MGELVRQNGDIIPIEIEYPLIHPSCDHCGCIGNILKDCIYSPSVPLKVSSSDQSSSITSEIVVPDPPIVELVHDPPDHDEELSISPVTDSAATSVFGPPDYDLVPSSTPNIIPVSDLPTTSISDPPDYVNLKTCPLTPQLLLPPFLQIIPLHLLPFLLTPKTIIFSSSPLKGSFIFGLPAIFAPTFGSYISSQQAVSLKE